MDDKYDIVKLCYKIHKCSSYSANYIPENIMVNNPSDQLSRWFTDNTTLSQYILLKLKSLSIVMTIKFGKYIKPHVNDLKKFQIYGGTDENNLSLLLTGGLKKDNSPETFRLRHRTTDGLYIPVRYLKIVPLQAWGPAYNYTIWYVELQGKNHVELINTAMETLNLRKEEEAVKILLKHLRRRRYKDAFEALSRESGVQLEGDLQARLWEALVENGDYELAEDILEEAQNDGEFSWYLSRQPYKPEWREVSPCSAQVQARLCCPDSGSSPPHVRMSELQMLCADRDPGPLHLLEAAGPVDSIETCEPGCDGGTCCGKPGPRGGHQLVVDPTTGTLYLFGGWNGTEDLDDLWSFDTRTERWTLLCAHCGEVGGPGPRSCHKMVFDPVHRRLYTLGRYLDSAQRVPENMTSSLHVYSVGGAGGAGGWWVACADTAAAGGPRLVFDHQMCVDARAQVLYVFGGRVLPAYNEEASSPQYSGLYAYHIESGVWRLLLGEQPDPARPAPLPRVSHSMLFHPIQRRLYIFAGQRNKEHLLELWWCDVSSGACTLVCAAPPPPLPPHPAHPHPHPLPHPAPAGFTQRATLDPDTDEMFVLSGMSKEKDKRVYNTLWVFSLRRHTWTCLYRNDTVSPNEPRPRFAHQLVYDPVNKVHYLFGGNPGSAGSPRLRLDDLWALRLSRAGAGAALSAARAALREARYRELCAEPARAHHALHYLRHRLAHVLDHDDPAQAARFQKLATVLFAGPGAGVDACACNAAACSGCGPGAGRALDAGRARTLARTRAARRPPLADHAMHKVLGADDSTPEPPQPYEEMPEPAPDAWDESARTDEAANADCPAPADRAARPNKDEQWDTRAARIRLYDNLCRYFRPSTIHPKTDIMNLVKL